MQPSPDEPPPPILDYEPPSRPARSNRPVSKIAILALATSLAALYASFSLARAVIARDTARWVEFAGPILPWIGIGLSINALLRTADQKENVSGDALAWIALLLSLISALASGCCLGLTLMNHAP
jgi:hypothetical protein